MKFTTLQAQGNTAVIPILQEVCRISRQDKKLALKSCLRDRKTAVLVWKCLHDSAPRHLVDLCVPAASTDGRRQSRSAVSGALSPGDLDSDVYWPAQLGCVWLQDLEPTTNGPPITRTVARFIQAPAQDPLVCSSTRQCWLQLWVSCTVVPSALL